MKVTPESRKVLDDYRDSLLGDGVSETARELVEEHVSQMEREIERCKTGPMWEQIVALKAEVANLSRWNDEGKRMGISGESIRRTVARNIIAFRKSLGLTQEQLAARFDKQQEAVARMESGEVDARLTTIELYAKALNVAPLALLSELPVPSRATAGLEREITSLLCDRASLESRLREAAPLRNEVEAWRWIHWGVKGAWACACGDIHGNGLTEPCEECGIHRPAKTISIHTGRPPPDSSLSAPASTSVTPPKSILSAATKGGME